MSLIMVHRLLEKHTTMLLGYQGVVECIVMALPAFFLRGRCGLRRAWTKSSESRCVLLRANSLTP